MPRNGDWTEVKKSSGCACECSTALLSSFSLLPRISRSIASTSMHLRGVGVSVVDHVLQELCYAYLGSLGVDIELSRYDRNLDFRVDLIQIDNSLFRTPFPILLHCDSENEQPAVQLVVSMDP